MGREAGAMETKLNGVTAADFLAALDMDDILPDDPDALDVRQLMALMQLGTHKGAKDRADKAVETGRLERFKTRRNGRIVTVYKTVQA